MRKLTIIINVLLVAVVVAVMARWFYAGEKPSDFNICVAFSYITFSTLLDTIRIYIEGK